MNIEQIVTLIIVLVVVLAGFIILMLTGNISKIKQALLSYVYFAEETYGGGTGELKFSHVAADIFAMLPTWLRPFMPTWLIRKLINDAVDRLKEYLQTNPEARLLLAERCEMGNSEANKIDAE